MKAKQVSIRACIIVFSCVTIYIIAFMKRCTGFTELSLLDNAIGAIISCAGSYMACEFYSAFIAVVIIKFSGPVTLHNIGPDRQDFFQRRTVNIFLSIMSPNTCFGAQMNHLLERDLLGSHS